MDWKKIIFFSAFVAYVAVVSFLAAYEDFRSHWIVNSEVLVRDEMRDSILDLYPYAMAGPKISDPCVHVARSKRPDAKILEHATGRHMISGTQFIQMFPRYKRKIGQLPNGIPKILHQTWWSRKVSESKMHLSASWLRNMPGWLHVLWDDDEVRNLFVSYRPDLIPMFDAYPYPVQKSDIFRYLVLDIYGGLYADMDYECVQDISIPKGIGGNATVYLSGAPNPSVDGLAQNTLMASTPDNPFWSHVMNVLTRSCGGMWELELVTFVSVTLRICSMAYKMRPLMGWTGISVLETTGPRMLSRAVSSYNDPTGDFPLKLLDVNVFNGQQDMGAKDKDPSAVDREYPCASHSIHRNSAGWTVQSPFPYTGEHTILRKRIPHRLIALLIIEVLAIAYFMQKLPGLRQADLDQKKK